MAAIRALFVEDDQRLAHFTKTYLEQRGVAVTHVRDGEAAVAEQTRDFDVIILDVMLPGRDGFDVCRALRQRTSVPIILVTARTEESDRVLGLELGADDYLVKPFSPRELLARLQALVRRATGRVGPPREGLVHIGRLAVDLVAMRVSVDGVDVALTSGDFQLLRVFVERRGRVLSREQLLELVSGSNDDAFDRAIDVRISRLRQKLGDEPRHPSIIRTIRGIGYVLPDAGGSETP